MTYLLRIPRLLAFAGIVLFTAWTPQQATAQANTFLQTILVASNGINCSYQILGQSNQEVFLIEPKGKVFISSSATSDNDVQVTVEKEGDVEGVQDEKTKIVKPGQKKAFKVRNGINRRTRHQIAINCCTDDACSSTNPAEPTTTLGALKVIPSVQEMTRMAVRGPDTPASESPNRSLRDGGPVMEVDDP